MYTIHCHTLVTLILQHHTDVRVGVGVRLQGRLSLGNGPLNGIVVVLV